MFGAKILQDLKQPCMWTVINLLKKKRTKAEQKIITLPEALLFVEQDKYSTETLEDVDLADEERWEYLARVHKMIDRVIDCGRPLHMRYGESFKPRRVTYNKQLDYFDSDTESDAEIRQAKEKLATLSSPRIANDTPQKIDYPDPDQYVPKTKLEKITDVVCRKAKTPVLYQTGPKAGHHLNRVKLGETGSALIIDDALEFRVIDPTTQKIIQNFPITSTQVKCTFVAESKLFIGMAFGAIWMYDAIDPYTKISHV